ncbi:unnamed protein product, partial [Ixodes hexagonus]
IAWTGGEPTVRGRLAALLTKRALHLRRSPLVILSTWLVPCMLFLTAFLVKRELASSLSDDPDSFLDGPDDPAAISRQGFDQDSNSGGEGVAISLGGLYGPSSRYFLWSPAGLPGNVTTIFASLLESEGAGLDWLSNAKFSLLDFGMASFAEYAKYYVLGGVFHGNELQGWYNPFANLSKAIAVGLLSTTLLRVYTDHDDAQISTTLSIGRVPGPGQTLGPNSGKFVWDQTLRTRLDAPLIVNTVAFASSWFMAVLVAGLVVFPVSETLCGAKALQLMTGVPRSLYCLSNWLVDFALYWVAWASVIVMMLVFENLAVQSYGTADGYQFGNEDVTSAGGYILTGNDQRTRPILPFLSAALVAVLLAYSWVAILFTYLVALHSATVAGACSAVFLTFAIGGSITTYLRLYLALPVADIWPYIDWVCLVAPPWSLPRSLAKVLMLDAQIQICSEIMDRSLWNDDAFRKACPSFPAYLEALASMTGHTFTDCCRIAPTDTSKEWVPPSPLSIEGYGVGVDVIVMLLEGAVLFCFLAWMDSGHSLRVTAVRDEEAETGAQDADVELEKDVVQDIRMHRAFEEHALVVRHLHKWHGKKHAVKGLYLVVQPRECFGLLGARGVGKTTTLEMLAGLVPMSTGEAYMQDVKLPKNTRK